VSLVTFPANSRSIVERVKDNRPAIDALASWIRSMKDTAETEQLRSALRSLRTRVRA
jgi:hypothetical protein